MTKQYKKQTNTGVEVGIENDLPASSLKKNSVNQDTLLTKLFKIQNEIKSIPKNGIAVNKQGKEYRYALLDDILSVVNPIFKEHNIMFYTLVKENSLVNVFVDINTGEYKESIFTLSFGSPQELGSQITYYRRYAISSILNLSFEDDRDGGSDIKKTEKEQISEFRKEENAKGDIFLENIDKPRSTAFLKANDLVDATNNSDALKLLKEKIKISVKMSSSEIAELMHKIDDKNIVDTNNG